MNIRIDPHTLERAEERGTTREEIREVLVSGDPLPAKEERRAKAKVFPFQRSRLGKYYRQKRVEVVYVVEGNVAVTVTVYVFYGEWKEVGSP